MTNNDIGEKIEGLDELLDDLKKIDDSKVNKDYKDEKDEKVESKRSELLIASKNGEITQKENYVKKASPNVIESLFVELESKRMERANAYLSDLFVSKFCEILGCLDAVKSPEELELELQNDVLLKGDVMKAASMISPYIPVVGLLSGGLTVGKHVYKHGTGETSAEPSD